MPKFSITKVFKRKHKNTSQTGLVDPQNNAHTMSPTWDFQRKVWQIRVAMSCCHEGLDIGHCGSMTYTALTCIDTTTTRHTCHHVTLSIWQYYNISPTLSSLKYGDFPFSATFWGPRSCEVGRNLTRQINIVFQVTWIISATSEILGPCNFQLKKGESSPHNPHDLVDWLIDWSIRHFLLASWTPQSHPCSL